MAAQELVEVVMTWVDHVEEDRRLALLRVLSTQSGYSVNDSVAQIALEGIGHAISRDRVRADFAWLAEQGLIHLEVVANVVHVARLSERGVDVALGRTIHPGVKRPTPR